MDPQRVRKNVLCGARPTAGFSFQQPLGYAQARETKFCCDAQLLESEEILIERLGESSQAHCEWWLSFLILRVPTKECIVVENVDGGCFTVSIDKLLLEVNKARAMSYDIVLDVPFKVLDLRDP